MACSSVVELEDASVRLGRAWALARLGLCLDRGEALWVTGGNGAGKTTLLRLMAGALRPSRGRVRLFGGRGPPWSATTYRRLHLMGHAHGLYRDFTGAENLRWLAALSGREGSEGRREVAARLAEVGLGGAAGVPLADYSAGMVRRLALARLLMAAPEVALVDEPFVQLDAGGTALVSRVLAAHLAAGGTLVFTSHDLELARPLASRRLHLAAGFAVPAPADGGPG